MGGSANGQPVTTSIPPAELAKLPYNHPVLDQIAVETEQRYGLPYGLLLGLKNAGERTNTGKVSPAGAKGVMQFIDSTRSKYQHDPMNPAESIDAAARYFTQELLPMYGGNVWAAIAHYNGGSAAGRAVMEGREPPSQETRDYLRRLRAFRQTLPV